MSINSIPGNVMVRNVTSLGTAIKLSEDDAKNLKEKLEQPPVGRVDADNEPSKIYATIKKDGRSIATLYLSGLMQTPSDISVPEGLVNDGQGPALAEARIRQMLAMHGGSVDYSYDKRARHHSETAATLFSAQIAGQ